MRCYNPTGASGDSINSLLFGHHTQLSSLNRYLFVEFFLEERKYITSFEVQVCPPFAYFCACQFLLYNSNFAILAFVLFETFLKYEVLPVNTLAQVM